MITVNGTKDGHLDLVFTWDGYSVKLTHTAAGYYVIQELAINPNTGMYYYGGLTIFRAEDMTDLEFRTDAICKAYTYVVRVMEQGNSEARLKRRSGELLKLLAAKNLLIHELIEHCDVESADDYNLLLGVASDLDKVIAELEKL